MSNSTVRKAQPTADQAPRPFKSPQVEDHGPARPGQLQLWSQLCETPLGQKIFLMGHLARLIEAAMVSEQLESAAPSAAWVARYMVTEIENFPDEITDLLLDNGIVPECDVFAV